jgi:hypothetical protein
MENRGDEATRYYVDMKLGGKTVKAGTYTLYAIPGKDSYTHYQQRLECLGILLL